MTASSNHNPENNKPVPFLQIILYNMAGFSFNLFDTILYAWLPYFYSPPADAGLTRYVPLAAFAAVLAGGRILDAVSDPLIGYLSDNTRSRWGRRKPYIFVSTPILFLAFILVWRPPVDSVSMSNVIYLATVLFFYYWAYTGVLIPWFAVLPEMSPNNPKYRLAIQAWQRLPVPVTKWLGPKIVKFIP